MRDTISLVLATRNKGKIEEITYILRECPVVLKTLDNFRPVADVEEDGKSFEENAYKKASFVARELGVPALADDSGLVVDALGGEPGVHSARYAGIGATAQERYLKLLRALEGKTHRKAAFECVISIAAPSGKSLTYRGRCEGVITTAPVGTSGFGYDPVFYYPPFGKTFGELTAPQKDTVSHRAHALAEMMQDLDNLVEWLKSN
jgi:XTP/dITP diphosphohydrolase